MLLLLPWLLPALLTSRAAVAALAVACHMQRRDVHSPFGDEQRIRREGLGYMLVLATEPLVSLVDERGAIVVVVSVRSSIVPERLGTSSRTYLASVVDDAAEGRAGVVGTADNPSCVPSGHAPEANCLLLGLAQQNMDALQRGFRCRRVRAWRQENTCR